MYHTFRIPKGGIVNAAAWSWVERTECKAINLCLEQEIALINIYLRHIKKMRPEQWQQFVIEKGWKQREWVTWKMKTLYD